MSIPFNIPFGIHCDFPEDVYYADAMLMTPTLSRSEMLTLLDESPLHCWSKHSRFGGAEREEATNKMDFGSLSHALVLGKSADIAVAPGEFENWMKNAAKEFRDEARANGQIPCLEKDFELAKTIKTEFRRELQRFGLDDIWNSGQSEVVLLWEEMPGCNCRCLIDRLCIDEEKKRAVIFDPKFSEDMNPHGLSRHMFNGNFHVQEQHYKNGLEKLRPDLAGRIDFIYLFMSIEAPYTMVPATLNGEFQMLGKSKIERGYAKWKDCLEKNKWPSFADDVVRVAPPGYAAAQEMAANI